MKEGHEQLCYYCGKPCNSLHGNPNLWPIPLCHPNEPGVVKWHHIGCISGLVHIAEAAIKLRNSGYDGPFGVGEEVGELFDAIADYEQYQDKL